MTHCTPPPLLFSNVDRKKIQADFDGGRLTSDTGVLLLREVDKRLKLVEAIDDSIPDVRHLWVPKTPSFL